MRIGVFGGSFDPVHKGHENIVRELHKCLELDLVLIIPTCISPFKQDKEPSITAEDRLAMLQLAFAHEPWVQISTLEIERGGVSYTIDTLRELKKYYPHDALFLLLSEESIETFSLWKEYEQLHHLAHIVFAAKKLRACPYGEVVEIPWIEVSSTLIRTKKVKLELYLSPKVLDYIQRHHLYS